MRTSGADHIPFVNSERDAELARQIYPTSTAIRVSLQSPELVSRVLGYTSNIWLDSAIDGLHQWSDVSMGADQAEPYVKFVKQFKRYDRIANQEFQAKPSKEVVEEFVQSVLDACLRITRPYWLSVPQLPVINGAGRNKINRLLAQQALDWKMRSRFDGSLVLPVIFTHRDQIQGKVSRDKKIAQIIECRSASDARMVWVVESSLADQEGLGTLDKRFAALICLHQELASRLGSECSVISGPYWGMNLVLWARGLAKFVAIGVGGSYRYHVAGGRKSPPKGRVALPPFRRRATTSRELETWLKSALTRVPSSDPAHAQLSELSRNFRMLYDKDASRRQVAQYYKDWFDKIAKSPIPGRALALYQDLSSAYVLGRTLPELPRDEGTARRPERIAQQLMLTCL